MSAQTQVINNNIQEIACGCWYTSTGRAIPMMFKYQDEEGNIYTIRDFRITESKERNFVGIHQEDFHCELIQEGITYNFRLLNHMTKCRWTVIWGSKEES